MNPLGNHGIMATTCRGSAKGPLEVIKSVVSHRLAEFLGRLLETYTYRKG